ncbi:hypothetical protein [Streptomyces sp. NPDC101149]|uniref:hypothetical protein n=1 Tax=Streptomyces sp. NPDC101149 TaxID=3366113 RepID=UPI0038097DE2
MIDVTDDLYSGAESPHSERSPPPGPPAARRIRRRPPRPPPVGQRLHHPRRLPGPRPRRLHRRPHPGRPAGRPRLRRGSRHRPTAWHPAPGTWHLAPGTWHLAVSRAIRDGVLAPAFAAAPAHHDTLRTPHPPAAPTQAQRDRFGTHTDRRTDRTGGYGTRWDTDRTKNPRPGTGSPAVPRAASAAGSHKGLDYTHYLT